MSPSSLAPVSARDPRLLAYELGRAFAEQFELDALIPLVTAKCREVLDAEGAAVLLIDPDHNEFYFPAVADENPAVTARLLRLRFSATLGVAGAAARAATPLRVDDAAGDPRFYAGIDQLTGMTTRCLLTAPLQVRQGVIGVLQVVNRRGGGAFTDDDLGFLEALAGSVAVAIENARRYALLKTSEEQLRMKVAVLRRDLLHRDRFSELVGSTAVITEVFRLMESAASSPIAVLIEGETGTGKELVARGIHRASDRSDGPFVAVNCAALPEALLESELFGHRRGAFTGAATDRRGLFEAAEGGTILLDEIGEMPRVMQAKLLRVLHDGEITPLGGNESRRVDVRVISATNRDLSGEIAGGTFRQDLYYRLAAFPIRLPPLRERRDDIALLVDHFLTAAAARHHKRIRGIEPEALDLLVRFDWPGNVRELENEIERAVALAHEGETVQPAHLSHKLRQRSGGESRSSVADGGRPVEVTGSRSPVTDQWYPVSRSAEAADRRPIRPAQGEPAAGDDIAAPVGIRRARAEFEARYIAEVLRQQRGNITSAARVLGLSRVMLRKKLKDYGLR